MACGAYQGQYVVRIRDGMWCVPGTACGAYQGWPVPGVAVQQRAEVAAARGQQRAVRRQRPAGAAQLHVAPAPVLHLRVQRGGQRHGGLARQLGLRDQVAQRRARLQLLAQQEHLGQPPRRHHRADEARVLAACARRGLKGSSA